MHVKDELSKFAGRADGDFGRLANFTICATAARHDPNTLGPED